MSLPKLLSLYHSERADLVKKRKDSVLMLNQLKRICPEVHQNKRTMDALLEIEQDHAEAENYHIAIIVRDFRRSKILVHEGNC